MDCLREKIFALDQELIAEYDKGLTAENISEFARKFRQVKLWRKKLNKMMAEKSLVSILD